MIGFVAWMIGNFIAFYGKRAFPNAVSDLRDSDPLYPPSISCSWALHMPSMVFFILSASLITAREW
jgi:hypothetical protein